MMFETTLKHFLNSCPILFNVKGTLLTLKPSILNRKISSDPHRARILHVVWVKGDIMNCSSSNVWPLGLIIESLPFYLDSPITRQRNFPSSGCSTCRCGWACPHCFMNTSNPSTSSCSSAESNSNLFGAGGGLEVHLRVPHAPGQHLFYVAGQVLHLLLESHVGPLVRKLPVAWE